MRWALAALIVLGASAVMIVAILLYAGVHPRAGTSTMATVRPAYSSPRDRVRATTRVRHLSRVHEVRRVPGGRGGRGAGGRRLFETAQLMPPDAGPELAGELVLRALGRARRMAGDGERWRRRSDQPLGLSMLSTLEGVEPETASEQSAFDAWLAQTNGREEARRDRLHAADGVVPFRCGSCCSSRQG